MTLLQALWLGIVEGVTEFLPISSTGHLIVASRALGLSGEFSDAFDVAVQSGAILSVLIMRRERFAALLPGRPEAPLGGWQGLRNLALISAPALILGFFFRKAIKGLLFGSGPVALATAVGGVAILLLDRERGAKRGLGDLSVRDALLIGLMQSLALWPGMSRSACTILGALALGYSREAATELSFMAAVPVLLAATGYETLKHWHTFGEQAAPLAVGLLAAFVAALFAIQGFIALLKRAGLKPWGWYRLAVAPLFWLWFK
jgi:undecaprenyl-diphosphatase